MKKNFYLSIFLSVIGFVGYSQDEFFETWYKINDGGGSSRERVTITTDSIVIERLQVYQVDTPYWEIDKISHIEQFRTVEDGIQIIGYEETQSSYTGGKLFFGYDTDQMIFFQLKDFHPEVDSIFKMIDNNPYKQLLGSPFYTKRKAESIEKYQSLDLISKEEIIMLFEFVFTIDLMIDGYLEDNKEVKWARMFAIRGLESMRDHKLIEMGFNPYAMTESYYGDRFRDDPDLIEMNNKSKYFKLF